MDDKKLEDAVEEAVDQGFNDDELQDIMNEIESLEKEFGSDDEPSAKAPVESPSAIDEELEAIAKVEVPEPVSESPVSPKENVVPMEPTSVPGAHMEFSGAGQMDFDLNFKIGEHSAHLKVDGNKGFVVEMSGVQIHIDEEHGCTVEMAGGVKFNVPFNDSVKGGKKAA